MLSLMVLNHRLKMSNDEFEDLKDMVKRYRLAYQKMKAMEKELKSQGDF